LRKAGLPDPKGKPPAGGHKPPAWYAGAFDFAGQPPSLVSER